MSIQTTIQNIWRINTQTNLNTGLRHSNTLLALLALSAPMSYCYADQFVLLGEAKTVTLTRDGTLNVTTTPYQYVCQLMYGPCPDILQRTDAAPGYYQQYVSGRMYTRFSSNNGITFNGYTNYIHYIGNITIPFCYSTPGFTAGGEFWWVGTVTPGMACNVTSTPVNPYTVPIRTTKTGPGIHTSTVQINTVRLGTNAQSAPWANDAKSFTIQYRIKNGVPVPPDTPVSCSPLTKAVSLNHGTVKSTTVRGHTAIAELTIKCDDNAIVEAQVGTGGTTGATVNLTNAGTAVVSVRGDDNSWGGKKQYNINNASKTINIRSIIENASPGQTSTGNTVLKLTYK
ncbi:hypothetical protein EJI20_19950 [Salmonella enterica subsp. enterica serovar Napoli]|nr:hypothetical protein [Salmonella enterica subsp. enterica serovar Napoli]